MSTPENNIIFLFTNFMYMFSLLAFSISKPWRREFFTNVPFMCVLIVVLTYSILLVICPAARIVIFQLDWMTSEKLNGFVLGISFLFGFFIFGVQKYIFEPGCAWLREKYPEKTWL